ncbi:MAG: manganese efflux pump MntP family protein [Lachnospiraceae bacterium]|nr:manganese efflux pump MntP family protein [Lachnospiraceae bacterium]
MEWSLLFFFNSILLGVGLAMDAFSVSLANGLNEPDMKKDRMCAVAGVFAVFQAIMPMIGWICVHTIVQYFEAFEKFIPWIALALLSYIGGKMLIDGIKNNDSETEKTKVGVKELMIQGIATSIDALSVGFTIAEYGLIMAIVCALIIAVVTFIICMAGLILGKKFGTRFSNKASILGGVILIVIGLEIFITGVLHL